MPLTKIKNNLMVWYLLDKEKEVDCVVSNLQKSASIQNTYIVGVVQALKAY